MKKKRTKPGRESLTVVLVDFLYCLFFRGSLERRLLVRRCFLSFVAAAALLSFCCIVPELRVVQPLGASDLALSFFLFFCGSLFVCRIDWLPLTSRPLPTPVFSVDRCNLRAGAAVLVATEAARSSNTPELFVATAQPAKTVVATRGLCKLE